MQIKLSFHKISWQNLAYNLQTTNAKESGDFFECEHEANNHSIIQISL